MTLIQDIALYVILLGFVVIMGFELYRRFKDYKAISDAKHKILLRELEEEDKK